jgi:hypothetical protein
VTHVNGGGSLTYIGGSYASFVITSIFAGVGGWSFQGAGSSTFIAVPQSRYAVTHNVVREGGGGLAILVLTPSVLTLLSPPHPDTRQYGNGGVHFLGAGILTLIANPQYSSYLLYYQAGAASDTFIGGACGWLHGGSLVRLILCMRGGTVVIGRPSD